MIQQPSNQEFGGQNQIVNQQEQTTQVNPTGFNQIEDTIEHPEKQETKEQPSKEETENKKDKPKEVTTDN